MSEKLLFSQLVVAAEEGTLESFIDDKGLVNVIQLMDHMSQYDAQKFEAYLAEHLNYTHHLPSNNDVVNKRDYDDDDDHNKHSGGGAAGGRDGDTNEHNWQDFSNYLQSLHTQYYEGLPEQEKQTYHGLMNAAQHQNMTQYVDDVGYGPIFGLLESLDYTHANELYNLLEAGLAASAPASVQKRERHDNDDDRHGFHNYLSGLQSSYYQNLPRPEKTTFNDLMAAAMKNNVTGYIDSVGYGPIFGLMEHLDYTHANRVYDFIELHLQSEAQTTAAA